VSRVLGGGFPHVVPGGGDLVGGWLRARSSWVRRRADGHAHVPRPPPVLRTAGAALRLAAAGADLALGTTDAGVPTAAGTCVPGAPAASVTFFAFGLGAFALGVGVPPNPADPLFVARTTGAARARPAPRTPPVPPNPTAPAITNPIPHRTRGTLLPLAPKRTPHSPHAHAHHAPTHTHAPPQNVFLEHVRGAHSQNIFRALNSPSG